jgi:hypothetical protein
LDKTNKILQLIIRLIFYSYFTVWSFSLFSLNSAGIYNFASEDDEAFLLPSQIYTSVQPGPEESKRTKNSGDSESGFYYSSKYLTAYGIRIFKLRGSLHFLTEGSMPILVDVNTFIDHSRPPPFSLI